MCTSQKKSDKKQSDFFRKSYPSPHQSIRTTKGGFLLWQYIISVSKLSQEAKAKVQLQLPPIEVAKR
ncbi:hypothetical protein [Leptotrichia hongkongensis]|uniref:hypothetical protein n=1 Tax=Leptotrichia hongkongensis TaxID=554406 RepID=UPI0035A825DA